MQKKVAAIYPLAPVQGLFLWHSLQYSSKAGLLHLQCELVGVVDAGCLQEAWQQVIQQHPALRTSIHWNKVKQPLQVVEHQVQLPWQVLDWRNQDDLQTALENWLNQDYQAGFDLNKAPLLRVCLIRLGETRYQLVCTTHHILLDGWSGNLILNQVFDCYRALCQGQRPQKHTVTPYQNYVRWLKAQDQDAAAQFWRTQLRGAVAAKHFAHSQGQSFGDTISDQAVSHFSISLAGEEHRKLQEFLRSQQLTLSSLLSGIWALLLHINHGETDVIFGMTVSGRQGDLAGIETIVGLLSNVLPIRVQVELEALAVSWLHRLQASQVQASSYSYVSPMQLQEWSGQNQALFNSLLVIENHQSLSSSQSQILQVKNLKSGIVSNYDLTILVKPQKQSLDITLQSRDNSINSALLERLGLQIQSLFVQIFAQPQASVETWLAAGQHSTQGVSVSAEHQHHSPQKEIELRALQAASSQFDLETIPPQNQLESQLLEIWESVLSISPISIHSSFFSLGGSSLSAACLFNKIEQTFKFKLPLSTLFEAPTIAKLSQKLKALGVILEEQNKSDQPVTHPQIIPTPESDSEPDKTPLNLWNKLQSLVPIKKQGSYSPFYFLPGGSGGIEEEWITYGKLLSALGSERPIYGLRARGLNPQDNCHQSVQDMAKDYIAEIQAVQPHGPYFLGGECIGGLIAYEMAQQLLAKGESVQSLFLLDTNPKVAATKIFFYHLFQKLSILKILDYYRFLRQLSPAEAIHQILKQIKRRIAPLQQHLHSPAPLQASIPAHPEQVSQNYKAITLRYQPKPYRGKLVVIATPHLSSQRKQAQWHGLAQGEFCFYPLSSDHHAYIREDSEQTAQVIRQHLEVS